MQTLSVLEKALGRRIQPGPTPQWLYRLGRAEAGPAWGKIKLIYRRLSDGLELPDSMPLRERRAIDGVLGGRGIPLRLVEVDEAQHFNEFRALTLKLYPEASLAFPRNAWLEECKRHKAMTGGGWAAPKPPLFPMAGGRNRQRAFRDALADLVPPIHGFSPTLRIAEFEVRDWLWTRNAPSLMRELVAERLDPSLAGSVTGNNGAVSDG